MKPCWVCKNNVKTGKRVINCKLCHGRVVTPSNEQVKRLEQRERERKELERMMSSVNTYKRRNGALTPGRHETD